MLQEDTKRAVLNFSLDIREQILRQLAQRGFGHLGGSMSVADIISVLYCLDMRIDPHDPQWDERDLLVCSKGHAGPAVYAALALKGFFPLKWMDTLNQPGTNLPSHCDRLKTPGIDMTTGSLGQGISVAAGMALSLKNDDHRERRVFCIIGDGEAQEGQVWEALLFAAQQKLHNLIVFLDYNRVQLDGPTAEIADLGDMAQKFADFGWYTQEIDGHDPQAIHQAILNARASQDKPCAIVADTVKGKDCSFAMGKLNHHVTVSPEQAREGYAHLAALRRALNH